MITLLYFALIAQPQMPTLPSEMGPEGRQFAQAIQVWTFCNVYRATKRALEEGSGESVVADAMKECSEDENEVKRRLTAAKPEFTQSLRDGLIDTIKMQEKQMLIKHVTDVRATGAQPTQKP